jgi:hypothetical protein
LAYAKAYAFNKMQTTKGSDQVKWTAQYVALDTGATDEQTLALFEAGFAESNFTNHNHGDLDSLGFLQQRPSQGWGTAEQVRNPEYAARKFMETAKKVRQGKGAEVIAQDTQRSACDGAQQPEWCGPIYGGNYKKKEPQAIQLINELRAESAMKAGGK